MTANSCVGVGNEETPYTIDYKLATTLWASVWRLLKTLKYSRAGPLLCGHPKTATAHHRDLRIRVYCCSWYSSKQTKSVCVAISKWPDKGSQKDKHCVPSVTRGSLILTVRYAYRGMRKCGWKLEKGCLWLEKDALSEGCGEETEQSRSEERWRKRGRREAGQGKEWGADGGEAYHSQNKIRPKIAYGSLLFCSQLEIKKKKRKVKAITQANFCWLWWRMLVIQPSAEFWGRRIAKSCCSLGQQEEDALVLSLPFGIAFFFHTIWFIQENSDFSVQTNIKKINKSFWHFWLKLHPCNFTCVILGDLTCFQ